jgi:flagellar basal-body rod protein FlgC
MLNAVTASLSGLVAAQRKLEVASRNVANADTDGYRSARVVLTEAPGGGVAAEELRDGVPGPAVVEERGGSLVAVEKSNVDLVREVGDLALAKPLYRANLKVLEARDEMLGSLLDVAR